MASKEATIIIPAYNVAKYIARCINSIIVGTNSDIEVLVIDDGSTDDTLKIADKIASIDNRVIVIEKKNQGVSSARNLGIELAQGRYVFFVDADDYVLPHTIDAAVRRFECSGCEALLLIAELDYGDGKRSKQKIGPEVISKIEQGANPVYAGYPTYTWNFAFTYEAIGHERFDEALTVSEDADFISRVCSRISRYEINEEVSYCYSVGRSDSALSKINLNGCKDIKSVKERIIRRARKKDCIDGIVNEYGAASFGVLRRCAINYSRFKNESRIPSDLLSLMKGSRQIKTSLCVLTHYHHKLMWPIFLLLSIFGKKMRIR